MGVCSASGDGVCLGGSPIVGLCMLQCAQCRLALNHLPEIISPTCADVSLGRSKPERHIFGVHPRQRTERNDELRSVAMQAIVGHGNHASLVVRHGEVLVLKLGPVYRPTCNDVTSMSHVTHTTHCVFHCRQQCRRPESSRPLARGGWVC